MTQRAQRGRAAYYQGLNAEQRAIETYEARGCELRETRWRGAGAELDLIFEKEDTIVVVEVKSSKTHATAAHNLSPAQLGRIGAAAEDYIGRRARGLLTDLRIDLATVDHHGQVEVIENITM